ncbi:caspase, EACC1-associated type [Streptomyces sp. NPDC001642]|uniref:caspase, EACC1-associated type n=1 Tax=Streptomyces sp. NPDC001642 TaxID=3154392 RepID=UPI0033278A04
MDMSDLTRSRAVIVGVGDYSDLPKLPSVCASANAVAELFCDERVWGLQGSDHCKVLINPQSGEEVLDAIQDAAGEAQDTFVVYFAGHGLVGPDGQLHLGLPRSHPQRLHRAPAFEEVRRLLVHECGALRKVVFLDCCYSGRALGGYMGQPVSAASMEVEGTYVMTSSAETKLSLAPEGEPYTAFSGELVKALSLGVPGASDPLQMDMLFQHVHRELSVKSRPIPQRSVRNDGASIALFRNRWTERRSATRAGESTHIFANESDGDRSASISNEPKSSVSASFTAYYYLLLDCSSGMRGERIAVLNFAMRELIPELRRVAHDNPSVELRVGVIRYGAVARWHVVPTPVDQFKWKDISTDEARLSDLGGALALVSNALSHPRFPSVCPPPTVVAVLGGTPNGGLADGLYRLDSTVWGPHVTRVAIPVGSGSSGADLYDFLGNSGSLIEANSPKKLAAVIRWADMDPTSEISPYTTTTESPRAEDVW